MAGNAFKTMAKAGKPGELTLEMTAYMGGISKMDETVFYLAGEANIYAAVLGIWFQPAPVAAECMPYAEPVHAAPFFDRRDHAAKSIRKLFFFRRKIVKPVIFYRQPAIVQ